MARPDTFSVAEVAGMTGVSKPTLVRQIKGGVLRASRVSRGSKHFYRIHRTRLVQYLMGVGYPLDSLRKLLNPDGRVILCRTQPAIQAALQAETPTLYVDSLFDLGRAVETEPAWAVVVDIPALTASESVRSLRPFYNESDRPEIVGLVGDDGIQCPSPIPFDVILPAGSQPPFIARSILTLRGVGG